MTALQPQRLSEAGFAPFGKIVPRPTCEPTARGKQFQYWSDLANYHIEGETEIGLCTVYQLPGHRVEWMERHMRTPEILVPIDGPLLLPVMEDGENGATRLFRVEVGEAVVLGPCAWHSACVPADGGEANYFVIFRRGTPQEDVDKVETLPVGI